MIVRWSAIPAARQPTVVPLWESRCQRCGGLWISDWAAHATWHNQQDQEAQRRGL